MSLLNPNIEADFDRYMEKRSEFERNFKSRVVSVLIIDPKNEFPLKDLRFEGISTKYFDISDITEQDFRLMGKWITERINDGGFSYDGLIFDNADVIQKADKVILLIDRSKLGRTLPFTFASLSDIDVVICDAPLPEDFIQAARAAGTEVLQVQPAK